jgi:hypothetical protein
MDAFYSIWLDDEILAFDIRTWRAQLEQGGAACSDKEGEYGQYRRQ